MRFWQLVSVCRERSDLLRQVLQSDDRQHYYQSYLSFDELVTQQKREVLDEIVPDELVVAVLKGDTRRLYLSSGHLRVQPLGDSDDVTTVLDVYQQFGGEVLEDVFEKGLVDVSSQK